MTEYNTRKIQDDYNNNVQYSNARVYENVRPWCSVAKNTKRNVHTQHTTAQWVVIISSFDKWLRCWFANPFSDPSVFSSSFAQIKLITQWQRRFLRCINIFMLQICCICNYVANSQGIKWPAPLIQQFDKNTKYQKPNQFKILVLLSYEYCSSQLSIGCRKCYALLKLTNIDCYDQ